MNASGAVRPVVFPDGFARLSGWWGRGARRYVAGEATNTTPGRPVTDAAPEVEGGEAPEEGEMRSDEQARAATDEALPAWYALWTRSNYERVVSDQLQAKGFETFLPDMSVWSARRGKRRLERRSLFPGYLFVRHALDKESYVEIVKARGLVRILGGGWDHPSPVPRAEVESVRTVVDSHLAPQPFPYLEKGQRVRIRDGALAGAEGILLERMDDRALLVVSIELFRRSISIEIDSALAEVA